MVDRSLGMTDNAGASEWFRIGVLLALANLVFIAILVVLLAYDLLVGIVFAIAVSAIGGIAIIVYTLRRRRPA